MKQKFEKFKAKLKNEKKFRTRFISVMVVSVVIIACAVTIPVELHNRVNVEAETESVAITAEAVLTESASVMITESETEVTSEITTEPTTAETTAQAANNAGAGNNTPANTNKGGGSNKSGGSDSSAKKPNSGSNGGQSQQKPPAAEQPNKKNPELDWTQADVDAAVAEAKRYAKSKGLTINADKKFTISIDGNSYNTSWSSPIDTRLDYKSNAKVDLHYQIDRFAKEASNDGVVYDINIFAENHGTYWEIYVVC